jgi:carbon-monoxide dehydrogenase large subunit
MVEKYGIGQSVPRFEDMRLLMGGGHYVDDARHPGILASYVLRSPHAHAKLIKIDVTAARKMPGVELVLTHADYVAAGLGQLPYVGPPVQNSRGIKPFFPKRSPLASGKVRLVGDPVAYIVANSLAAAKDAAEVIDVVYEPLPSITTTADAARGGTPAIWDEQPNNIGFVHEAGDEAAVDAAIAKAAHVVKRRLHIPRVLVSSMEGRGCVASYDPAAEFCTIQVGTQSVYASRADYARIFNVPESMFRVIAGDVGGSFGMKGLGYPEHILAVWASRLLGRPVKWVAERSEGCLTDNHGRDNVSDATLALDKDGKFLAFKVETSASLGAYPSAMASGAPTNNIGSLAGVYTTPHVFVRVTGVYTNNAQTGPFRGAGRPEAAYVIERMVDLAAAELKIDRVELRRRNMIPPITKPYKTGLTFIYDSGEFEAVMNKSLALADYAGFARRREESQKAGKLRGFGIATVIERAAPPGLESVEVRVGASGTVTVFAGTTDQGQGHKTMYTQIICDRFGVDPAKIRVVEGDTETLAHGMGTGGSRVSAMGSSAALIAIDKVIAKGRKVAAHTLETAEADVEFKEGKFRIAGTDRVLPFAEVARIAYTPNLLPKGMEPGLNETGTYTSTVTNYPNGCQICEVEVDPDTGITRIDRYCVVDDVGTVLNPLGVKGQIHGGVAMGAGEALMEQAVFDPESGQMLTGSFMDYSMPRSDLLPMLEVASHPVPTPTNPLGAKGVGEAGTVGALPAVMNAVIDALSPYGIQHLDIPLTPERLWRAMRAARI